MIYLREDEDIYTEGMEPKAPPPKPTPWYEAAGMGFMRGAVDVAGAATLAAGGLYGAVAKDPYGMALGDTNKNEIFDAYQDYIQPAKTYWTPDPESVGLAGRTLGAIAAIGVPLMLGPGAAPALIGT